MPAGELEVHDLRIAALMISRDGKSFLANSAKFNGEAAKLWIELSGESNNSTGVQTTRKESTYRNIRNKLPVDSFA